MFPQVSADSDKIGRHCDWNEWLEFDDLNSIESVLSRDYSFFGYLLTALFPWSSLCWLGCYRKSCARPGTKRACCCPYCWSFYVVQNKKQKAHDPWQQPAQYSVSARSASMSESSPSKMKSANWLCLVASPVNTSKACLSWSVSSRPISVSLFWLVLSFLRRAFVLFRTFLNNFLEDFVLLQVSFLSSFITGSSSPLDSGFVDSLFHRCGRLKPGMMDRWLFGCLVVLLLRFMSQVLVRWLFEWHARTAGRCCFSPGRRVWCTVSLWQTANMACRIRIIRLILSYLTRVYSEKRTTAGELLRNTGQPNVLQRDIPRSETRIKPARALKSQN